MRGRVARWVLLHVSIERREWAAAPLPWHAQFCVPPYGWFRGWGRNPAHALSAAWHQARSELPPAVLADLLYDTPEG